MENSEKEGKKQFKVDAKDFIPELELNRGFYSDIVKGMIERRHPNLQYAAGLTGHCSGCLGFDTHISTDHGWGPRLQIFLNEEDHKNLRSSLNEMFSNELPLKYRGFPTNQFKGCWGMEEIDEGPVNHWIQIETIQSFFNNDVYWDCDKPPTLHEWLSFTDQGLRELTSGEIYHDGIGKIAQARKWISYYPDEVWFFKMWCLWSAIVEEDAFVGRSNDLNDFIGEKLITSRIINKLMKLCFLVERQYYPYSKWFGTAFTKLHCGHHLSEVIKTIMTGNSFTIRNNALCQFYQEVGTMHNQLEITEAIDTNIINYHGRPYKGMDPEPFCSELRKLFESCLQDYNLKVLSKTVLYDDSYLGSYKDEMKKIADLAREDKRGRAKTEEGADWLQTTNSGKSPCQL